MSFNKIISNNSTLCYNYIKYINTTKNLCIYKFCNVVPNGLKFPNANTLTLINCSKNGVSNIFNPDIVPNIKRINYISTEPNDTNIYKRFPESVEWMFPDKNLDFYNNMIIMGRGKKCDKLINEYVASKKIIDGTGPFDIGYEFDLKVPDFGVVNGEWWRSQFNSYLLNYSYNSKTQLTDVEELHLVQATEEMALEKARVEAENELYLADELLFK
jgi:hypothetical protein